MTTIILCGGSGTRLWPLSRAALPKQFAAIVPGGSLFEGAVRRNLEFGSGFIVAANAGQGSLASAQLDGLGVKGYRAMVEPVGRNTAPAIALACMMLAPDEVVLVAPSDHLVRGLNFRHSADIPGNRLRLHRDRRRGRALVQGEAGRRHRRALPGVRAVPLELRDVLLRRWDIPV